MGDIDTEMLLWYRPEEQALPRPAFAVDLATGAADLGGSVSAALAAASVLFSANNETEYAARLLDKAQEVRGRGAAPWVAAAGALLAGLLHCSRRLPPPTSPLYPPALPPPARPLPAGVRLCQGRARALCRGRPEPHAALQHQHAVRRPRLGRGLALQGHQAGAHPPGGAWLAVAAGGAGSAARQGPRRNRRLDRRLNRRPSPPLSAPPCRPTPQDSYLSDVYDFYMKHLEDEGPVAGFKCARPPRCPLAAVLCRRRRRRTPARAPQPCLPAPCLTPPPPSSPAPPRYAYDWDNVFYPLNLLLAQETGRPTFRDRAQLFLRNWVCAGNTANYTARGRAYNPYSGAGGAGRELARAGGWAAASWGLACLAVPGSAALAALRSPAAPHPPPPGPRPAPAGTRLPGQHRQRGSHGADVRS